MSHIPAVYGSCLAPLLRLNEQSCGGEGSCMQAGLDQPSFFCMAASQHLVGLQVLDVSGNRLGVAHPRMPLLLLQVQQPVNPCIPGSPSSYLCAAEPGLLWSAAAWDVLHHLPWCPFLQQGRLPKLPVLKHMLQRSWPLIWSVTGGRANLLCLFRAGGKNRELGALGEGGKMETR